MVGVVATMRKLLLLVYTLWKNGEVYDPNRTVTSTPRTKKDNRIVDEDGRLLVPLPDVETYIPSVVEDNSGEPPF